MQGTSKMPFITRSTWLTTQSECGDLRRTHAHLSQGTRPSKKATNIKDIKRYLNVASISKDGMLIVKQTDPLAACRERIIVPRSVLLGLLTAIHIRLNHPTIHQLKQVTTRYFFALNLDEAVAQCTNGCHNCASLKVAPKFTEEQTSSAPPETIGICFAADVLKQNRQLILLLRECVTSYTTTCLLNSEDHASLRDGLISLAVELRPLDGPHAVIRVDPAPGFSKLKNDKLLYSNRIALDIGRVKNKNKNPVAEKAIQELENELIRINPNGNVISLSTLAIATSSLNSRIRLQGLSSRELWTQRDQFTHCQLPMHDQQVIQKQYDNRLNNHECSKNSKGGKDPQVPAIIVGDLVYLYADKDKSLARNRYIVVSVDNPWCTIRKFVGNQLRNNGYKVLITECYSVYSPKQQDRSITPKYSSDEEEVDHPTNNVIPRIIPPELTDPPTCFQLYPDHTTTSTVSNDFEPETPILSDVNEPSRRSTRSRKLPTYLQDYETS